MVLNNWDLILSGTEWYALTYGEAHVIRKKVLSVVSLNDNGRHLLMIPCIFFHYALSKIEWDLLGGFITFFFERHFHDRHWTLKSVWAPLLLQNSSDTLSSSNIIPITGLFSFQINFLSWLPSIHWSKRYIWMCCLKIGSYECTSKKTLSILFIWYDTHYCWKLSTEYVVIF